MKTAKNIDSYIKGFHPDIQKILKGIRREVKKVAPKAEETISYGMPTFKLNGTYLIYFAAWKGHISLYPGSANLIAKVPTLAKYQVSKGTLKFPDDKPIPATLIKKIVQFRLKEGLAKLKSKSKN